jgi:hypothetical protein
MQQGNEVPVDLGSWVEESWEEECGGCSTIRVQLGAIGANRAFELEMLSQHKFMIEKIQDESYAQHIQIKENRMKMATMQQRLEQLEGTQLPPSNTGEKQENSRNVESK